MESCLIEFNQEESETIKFCSLGEEEADITLFVPINVHTNIILFNTLYLPTEKEVIP